MGSNGAGMRSSSEREGGFTLMELLVVVSIISILAVAFGASFLGWREQYRAESDIKKIYSAFMDAKINALKERRHVFVHIPETSGGDDQVIRLYKDVSMSADDPLKPGDGLLDTAEDEQLGPDIVLNLRLVINPDSASYRKTWFNARGQLRHLDYDDPTKRDFDILLMQIDDSEMAESDLNCLTLTPPLYISGGTYNGTSCELK